MTKLQTAMILAAGKGTRMRELSEQMPKPMVLVNGISLVDRLLAHAEQAGIEKVIINVHHLAGMLEHHLAPYTSDGFVEVSDERGELLETGGGVKKALPKLGNEPFLVMNGDALWIDKDESNIDRLAEHWNPEEMDVLLLLVPTDEALGYDGVGDFLGAGEGAFSIEFLGEASTASNMYAGVQIVKPEMYEGTPDGAFSNVEIFRKAAQHGRLYGLVIDGSWMHVGTPEAVKEAEEKLKELGAA
ncbi:nucleotidyltransferase family protein [Kordiimonas laminariae]|uniref:nucleotidyltransferase family protein n=1 Tax=Kordiimonas laminariae TaxID=2917717 RepID=UPI001FF10D24|nr:nucleotidyltransferase family protein [Kordiimonas laminariae]MCK0069249.1 nucleotidyltransferase family protein [Kordiimonas laminariae]